MKKFKKICAALLLGCMTILTAANGIVPAMAAPGGNEEKYTYTVTLYAGNQGSFSSTSGVQVDNHKTGSSYQISSPQDGGDKITVTGLEYGDIVSVSAQRSVTVGKASRYYVGGIRESGQDNNTVSKSAFAVEGDREYVVAYGIRSNMVAYTVHYIDEEGNALLESETYYGAVGDRPVIAFRYIDCYWPQTYNLTKQLSANAAENVFTFVYTPMWLYLQQQEGEQETEIVYEEDPNANRDDDENDDANANIQEEDPADLINLDEEDVPLAYQIMQKLAQFAKEKPMEFMGVSALVLALLAALILLIIFKRKKKKNEEEAEPESGTESKEEKKE